MEGPSAGKFAGTASIRYENLAGSPARATGPMSTKRVQVIVRGRVTGVFFRAAAQREAKRLGITGWVKNRPDGSVEIVAEAEEEAIKEMISWSHHGPSAARVDDVDVRWRGYTGEFSDFRIMA